MKLATCSICGENRQEGKGQWVPTCDVLGNPLYLFVCDKCEGRRPA